MILVQAYSKRHEMKQNCLKRAKTFIKIKDKLLYDTESSMLTAYHYGI